VFAQEKQVLRLVETIALSVSRGVSITSGRDAEKKRLFVAAVANNTPEVVELGGVKSGALPREGQGSLVARIFQTHNPKNAMSCTTLVRVTLFCSSLALYFIPC
jgi:hypothetical protein